MIKQLNRVVISFMIVVSGSAHAAITDNRFFPQIPYQFLAVNDYPSNAAGEVFFITASSAFGPNEETIGIPELYGNLDQGQLANAFVASGRPNPLPTEFQGAKIMWKMFGKLSGQGFGVHLRKALFGERIAFGLNTLFMRSNNAMRFELDKHDTNLVLGPGDPELLDQLRRQMFEDLGLGGPNTTQVGVGDIDAYIRIGNVWDYLMKFRSIRAGVSLGVIFPTGEKRNDNKPPSIPFGGNGHWGLYGQTDVEFEVREDMKVGMQLQLTNRFARLSTRRMPSSVGEPEIFGTIVGDALVEPGITACFTPYVLLENLRDGFGVRLRYALTAHVDDDWRDKRSNRTYPTSLCNVRDFSGWGSDYFLIKIFYDFGKTKVDRGVSPIISFSWDVPAMFFVTQRVVKTHSVALGLEFNF